MTSWNGWLPSHGSRPERAVTTLPDQEAGMLKLLERVNKSGKMPDMLRRGLSPVGTAVAEDIRRQKAEDDEYREVRARFARAEAVARLLIQFRMKHNLTQDQLAQLMGTSAPAISRLESGTHVPSLTTLARLAEAAGERLVIGFAKAGSPANEDERTLVQV